MTRTLVGAYGRDYKNIGEIKKDFDEGKDFLVVGYGGGGYVTKQELREAGIDYANVRYKNNTRVCVLKTFQ